MPLAIVIECENLAVWQGNPIDGLSPAVFTIGIFIDIVTQMNDIVNRSFSCWISIGVEVPKRII